jgi:hypothetical protein
MRGARRCAVGVAIFDVKGGLVEGDAFFNSFLTQGFSDVTGLHFEGQLVDFALVQRGHSLSFRGARLASTFRCSDHFWWLRSDWSPLVQFTTQKVGLVY